MQSILATFNHTMFFRVREVLHELKHKQKIKVDRVIFGQLFEDMTVCLLTNNQEIPAIMEKFLQNKIKIFPYNDEYRKTIREILNKLNNSIKYYNNNVQEVQDHSLTHASVGLLKQKSKITPKFEKLLNKIDIPQGNNFSIIDRYNEQGNYKAISNIIGSNSAMSRYAKEKFVSSIKNCIQLILAKGLENRDYADEAISKLKEIVTDKEIKSILTDDLTGAAGQALLIICTEQEPEELINIVNLFNAQQKVNVMAAVRLSELLFKEIEVDISLLKLTVQKVNVRFLLLCIDSVATLISDESIIKLNKILGAIKQYKESN